METIAVISASATGAAAALAPTLTTDGMNFLACTGFEITGAGATAASLVTATLTGCLGGTRSYVIAVPAGVSAGITPLVVKFDPPLPSATNGTSIVLNVPSLGAGNTAAAANIQGIKGARQLN